MRYPTRAAPSLGRREPITDRTPSCAVVCAHAVRSWRDDGTKKFARLHEHAWGADTPSIWLDKVCAHSRAARTCSNVAPI